MGTWNTHGMDEDDVYVWDAINTLCLHPSEMEALIESCRAEQWIWQQMAKHKKGQEKRKANLIAKHYGLRMEKWIELTARAEMDYEETHGQLKETASE